jgi:hypothetical protein
METSGANRKDINCIGTHPRCSMVVEARQTLLVDKHADYIVTISKVRQLLRARSRPLTI